MSVDILVVSIGPYFYSCGGGTMVSLMQEPTAQLQILIPRKVRNRLKAEAAVLELDMGTLGGLVLEYGLGLIAANKAPAALKKAIEDAQRQKQAEDEEKKD